MVLKILKFLSLFFRSLNLINDKKFVRIKNVMGITYNFLKKKLKIIFVAKFVLEFLI